MTIHVLRKSNPVSKFSGFLQASLPRTSAPLRDEPIRQGNQSITQPSQALRSLKQSYSLERRSLL